MFFLTETYTPPAGNPPSPGDTARYRSISAPPVSGRVAKVDTAPVGDTADTASTFCLVSSRAEGVHAMPTGRLIDAKGAAIWVARERLHGRVPLSGDQPAWT